MSGDACRATSPPPEKMVDAEMGFSEGGAAEVPPEVDIDMEVSRRRRSEEADCDDPSQFEAFPATLSCQNMPIIVFTDKVSEQRVWDRGCVDKGRVVRPTGPPDMVAKKPVVMSPAYLGFAVEPYEERYLHFRGVGIVFSRPRGGQFMQPSIDTLLVCQALGDFFKDGRKFERIIDVGAGSGFIGKFAAVHSPGVREVCLVDTDPVAKEYWETTGFGSANVPGVRWNFQACDACRLLEEDAQYNLIISNPPYQLSIFQIWKSCLSCLLISCPSQLPFSSQ